MCSNYDEHTCPQPEKEEDEEEEEEERSEWSTSPHSYPAYNSRFNFNKRQKSSLGKFRTSRIQSGAYSASVADPTSKDEENDTDFSKATDDSQHPQGPFTAKTPHVKGSGLSWMRETPGNKFTPFNFGLENSLGPVKNLENGYKTSAFNFDKPHPNISENDSGLDVSYPSSIFSNNKNERVTSIFNPTVCKRNIKFDTPCKNNEDKENLVCISESKPIKCSTQNSSKKTQHTTRLGLFGYKIKNDYDNVNDFGKQVDISDSNEMGDKNQPFETYGKRITLFNQKSNVFENILLNSNIPSNVKSQEYNGTEIKSQPQEHQPRVSLFDSKSNLFENKLFTLNQENNKHTNLKEIEKNVQFSKNPRVTLFDTKPRISENQATSNSLYRTKQNSNSDAMNNETYEVPKYIPLAHKTIFDKPFLFTAGSKPASDNGELSDESLSTPLDLSSGEHLNKVNFNNSEQSSHASESVITLDNSANNIQETAGPPKQEMGNEGTGNDSGINMTEQNKVNTQNQLLEAKTEINLLPTPLVLACPQSLLLNASLKSKDSSDSSESMNMQTVSTEHHNIVIPYVKNRDNHIPVITHNLENDKIESGIPFLQSTSSNLQCLTTETQKPESFQHQISCQSHLNLHNCKDLHSEVHKLKVNAPNLLPYQHDTVLNQQQTNFTSVHQPVTNKSHNINVVTTRPELETIIPTEQSLQNHNSLMTKSEVPIQSVIPQIQPLQNHSLILPKSEILVQTVAPQIQPLQYNNKEAAKSEVPVESVIPQRQSLYHLGTAKPQAETVIHLSDNNLNILPVASTNLNKHHSLTVKSESNQIQPILSFSQPIVEDHKKCGSQLNPFASIRSEKLCSNEKPMTTSSSYSENHHHNSLVKSSMIPLPAHQLPTVSNQNGIISQSEPIMTKNQDQYNSSGMHQVVPNQQTYPLQQPVGHQQQSFVGLSRSKSLMQKQPIVNPGHQPRLRDFQSGNQLHHAVSHVQPINPAQSYITKSNDFIKPSNPAPRFGDRLSALKNKPRSEPKPISNMQGNYGISTGISTRMSQCLYVNGKGYTVLSTLGKGGSSEVYQVLDPNTSTLMAVKCVDLTMVDHTIAEGYLNEIELLSQLQGCTTVIKMFDNEYVKESKMLYVVMEKGDTDLSKLIRDICKTTKISMSMIIYYWTEMLTVVRDIHNKGIIHSDLKPANFLLVSGRLKLIDFGIASSMQGDMTSVHKEVTTGTWNYMSPEALRNTGGSGQGFKITYRSDVWSLGCILYNLIYGKTPFSHITHTWNKLQAIADPNHRIEFPSRNIPPVLDQALKSCFHRDPKQRPTVAQLLDMPYHTTVDQISLGKEVKNLLPAEWWTVIQHLFESKTQEHNKEKESAG